MKVGNNMNLGFGTSYQNSTTNNSAVSLSSENEKIAEDKKNGEVEDGSVKANFNNDAGIIGKLMEQKQKVQDQLNELDTDKTIKMTEEQKKERKKELKAQLQTIDESIAMEQKEEIEKQQDKKKEEQAKIANQPSLNTDKAIKQQQLTEETALLSAYHNLSSMQNVQSLKNKLENESNIIDTEIKLDLGRGSEIGNKSDRLQDINASIDKLDKSLIKTAMKTVKDLPREEETEETTENQSNEKTSNIDMNQIGTHKNTSSFQNQEKKISQNLGIDILL